MRIYNAPDEYIISLNYYKDFYLFINGLIIIILNFNKYKLFDIDQYPHKPSMLLRYLKMSFAKPLLIV
jgi:hypothetical protein